VIAGLVERELLALEDGWLRLTAQGRLLSNEVFAASFATSVYTEFPSCYRSTYEYFMD